MSGDKSVGHWSASQSEAQKRPVCGMTFENSVLCYSTPMGSEILNLLCEAFPWMSFIIYIVSICSTYWFPEGSIGLINYFLLNRVVY